MTKIDLAKGMKQQVGLSELTSLQDEDGNALKFKLENHDAVHEGAFPIYKAKSKDGKKEYVAELSGEINISEIILPEKEEKPTNKAEDKPEKEEKPVKKEDKEDDSLVDRFKGPFSDSKKK